MNIRIAKKICRKTMCEVSFLRLPCTYKWISIWRARSLLYNRLMRHRKRTGFAPLRCIQYSYGINMKLGWTVEDMSKP